MPKTGGSLTRWRPSSPARSTRKAAVTSIRNLIFILWNEIGGLPARLVAFCGTLCRPIGRVAPTNVTHPGRGILAKRHIRCQQESYIVGHPEVALGWASPRIRNESASVQEAISCFCARIDPETPIY